jgi:hypothetical protein
MDTNTLSTQITNIGNQIANLTLYNTVVSNPFEEPRINKAFISYKLKADREPIEGYAYLNQTYPNPLQWKWKCFGEKLFLVFRIDLGDDEDQSSEEEYQSSEEEEE